MWSMEWWWMESPFSGPEIYFSGPEISSEIPCFAG